MKAPPCSTFETQRSKPLHQDPDFKSLVSFNWERFRHYAAAEKFGGGGSGDATSTTGPPRLAPGGARKAGIQRERAVGVERKLAGSDVWNGW